MTPGPPAAAAPPPSKLLELEGLRGVAALFVVCSHLQTLFFSDELTALLHRLDATGSPAAFVLKLFLLAPFNGRFCVWIFWTLSGFALSYHYFLLRHQGAHAKARAYLPAAALRRYPRLLLPVLAATIFAFLLIRLGWMHAAALAPVVAPPGGTRNWIAANYNFVPTLGQTLTGAFWTTFFSLHAPPIFDPPLWTMKREIFGSFFLFAFLAVFGARHGRWFVYLAAALLFVALRQTWLDSFLAGIVLCDFRVNHLTSFVRRAEHRFPRLHRLRASPLLAFLVLAALLSVIGYFNQTQPAEIDSDPVSDCAYIIVAFLIMVWIEFSSVLKHLLSRRPFAFLGQISFGLYISHYPFLFSASALFYLIIQPHFSHAGAALLTIAASLPAVLGLGTLFYLLADKPSVPLSKWLATRVLKLWPDHAASKN